MNHTSHINEHKAAPQAIKRAALNCNRERRAVATQTAILHQNSQRAANAVPLVPHSATRPACHWRSRRVFLRARECGVDTHAPPPLGQRIATTLYKEARDE